MRLRSLAWSSCIDTGTVAESASTRSARTSRIPYADAIVYGATRRIAAASAASAASTNATPVVKSYKVNAGTAACRAIAALAMTSSWVLIRVFPSAWSGALCRCNDLDDRGIIRSAQTLLLSQQVELLGRSGQRGRKPHATRRLADDSHVLDEDAQAAQYLGPVLLIGLKDARAAV